MEMILVEQIKKFSFTEFKVTPSYKKTAHSKVPNTNSRIRCEFFANIRLFIILHSM